MKKFLNILSILTIIIIVGCSKKPLIKNSNPLTEDEEDKVLYVENADEMYGKEESLLTGEYIDIDIANKRPIAFVINNIRKALPQSGISEASIFYEVIAEGDITRIIALFEDYNQEKIGPVRSARHYFLDLALNHNAIFIHHGGSPLAYSDIDNLNINNVDGMVNTNSFFRDQIRLNTTGMYEHSSYVNGFNLKEYLPTKYSEDLRDDFTNGFSFYPVVTTPLGYTKVDKVIVPFSSTYISKFEYDPEMNIFYKFHEDEEHLDIENGHQLAVSNILIQKTYIELIDGDDAGRRDVELIGSGTGYLITNGVYVPVKWSKASHHEPTMWFNPDGSKLQLNKGKTWICIVDSDKEDIIFEEYEYAEDEEV